MAMAVAAAPSTGLEDAPPRRRRVVLAWLAMVVALFIVRAGATTLLCDPWRINASILRLPLAIERLTRMCHRSAARPACRRPPSVRAHALICIRHAPGPVEATPANVGSLLVRVASGRGSRIGHRGDHRGVAIGHSRRVGKRPPQLQPVLLAGPPATVGDDRHVLDSGSRVRRVDSPRGGPPYPESLSSGGVLTWPPGPRSR